ncbi:SusD/RagB family nutrient-binding outer membrane lipoprotein [Puteibacter caeruleilacunae]|nr:SusD/RagB family nutrient-binding outer membrane lipoprotein [Puteibacter caeruleilacunae]
MNTINKLLSLLFIVVLVSCDDFGTMNENPNAPSEINNNPELLLTGICKDIVNDMVVDAWNEGNVMAQYSAKIVFTAFDQFEWGSNSGSWNKIYSTSREIQNLLTISETINNTSYEAVGLIMRAWMFQILTDMWGDVPYKEALQAKKGEIFTPVYDKQEEIYVSLLADLKEANTLLSQGSSSIKGDIIYNGDLNKWKRFANSLRLRLLIRLTNVDGGSINLTSELREIIANPSANPVMEGNDDNAILNYTTSFPNVHPKSEASGYRIGSYDEYRMSETIEDVLEAYSDPRQMKLFAPTENSVNAGPDYAGMQNGMVDGSAYEYKGGPSFISAINPETFYYSANNVPGMIMLASEVQFIIAEAAARYPEIASIADAKSHYEKGITLNFEFWNVDLPADYLTRTSSNSEFDIPVNYDGNIETIITQKWIALFFTDYQGFIEYKRTGYPHIIEPGPDTHGDSYPSRYLYPDDEQALNLSNHDAAATAQAGSVSNYSYWTPVWWENK